MNKFAIALLTAAMTLGSGAALAADNNGTANQAADAGAASGGSEQTMAPNNVNNNKINEGSHNTAGGKAHKGDMKHHSKMSASQIHKNSECKDGKCTDINKKVGPGADHKTDGTTQ